ncbi:MAG: hypothetical protein AAF799_37975 [Myxococcota bacterium]
MTMSDRIRELRAACLPFVTRSLRGARARRLWFGAGLLALLVLICGTYMGKSPGSMARGLRVDFGLEASRWEQSDRDFSIIVDTPDEKLRVMRRAESSPHDPPGGRIHNRAVQGWLLLDHVSGPHVIPPRDKQGLQQRARALRHARVDLAPPDLAHRRQYEHYNWYSPQDQQRLEAIIDAELKPSVVVYKSPLDGATTLRLIGTMAGGLLLLLAMVIAPLWVGVKVAQELHENTLQPLTGTALTARQLVIGLIVGALVPVAIVATPLAAIVLATAFGWGSPLPAVGLMLELVAMSTMLIALAMLAAMSAGRRRAPGLIGIALLALLGGMALLGASIGLHLSPDTLGAVTLAPAASSAHLLAETFFPVNHFGFDDALGLDFRLALVAVGAAVLSAIGLRAIERSISGDSKSGVLRRGEAGLAAAVLMVLASASIPELDDYGPTALLTLGIAMTPVLLVFMGRVPGGDVPPSMRRIPVKALLGELAVWCTLPLLLAVLVSADLPEFRAGAIVGTLHLLWALGVFGLVAIRIVALPTTILQKVWVAVCIGFAVLGYVTGAIWCFEPTEIEFLFPLAAATPILGVVHISLYMWIPVSLLQPLLPPAAPADAQG